VAGLLVPNPDKLAEEAGGLLGGHPDAGVLDLDHDGPVPAGDAHLDATAVAVVLHRIADKVVENDLQFAAIGGHGHGAGSVKANADVPPFGLGGDGVDGRAGNLGDVHGTQFASSFAGLDPRQVEQVEDQLPHTLDPRHRAGHLRIIGG